MKKKAAKRKPAARKVKKKAPARKAGGNRPGAKTPVPPVSAEATRLGIVVEQTEKVLEKASKQLADARERVARAAETAQLERTGAALTVADRAREEVAAVNKHHLDVVVALRAVRDAVSGSETTLFNGTRWSGH